MLHYNRKQSTVHIERVLYVYNTTIYKLGPQLLSPESFVQPMFCQTLIIKVLEKILCHSQSLFFLLCLVFLGKRSVNAILVLGGEYFCSRSKARNLQSLQLFTSRDAEDFEPEDFANKPSDRWEGEDEDDVKESWEDEEEEEKKDDKSADSDAKPFQRKKKKPLAERIAEKEAAKLAKEEEEKKQKTPLSAEEELTEKLRREKIQKEADLKLAQEAFGVDATGIDAMYPETEEEYNTFEEALKTKISFFEKSKHYVPFLEKLFTDLVVSLEGEDVKRLGATLNTVFHEKQRQQKEQDKKKKNKKKIVIKAERDNDFGDLAAASTGDYDDFYDDDFI